jgi:hypothetical protein
MGRNALDFLLDAEAELDAKAIEIRVSMVQLIAVAGLVVVALFSSLGTLYLRVLAAESRIDVLEQVMDLRNEASQPSEGEEDPPAGVPVGTIREGLGATGA